MELTASGEPLYLVRLDSGTEVRGLTLDQTLPYVTDGEARDVVPDGYRSENDE